MNKLLLLCVLISLSYCHHHDSANPNFLPGKTTAAPGWKRIGNHSYYPLPLIATDNEMPLLVGSYGDYRPHETLKYKVHGSLDGTGIEQVGDYYYVYVSHEYHSMHTSSLPGSDETFQGAMMSLFMFTLDFQIVGGKYLVESKRSATTGDEIPMSTPFGGLCSATLVTEGFVDGPIFLANEEGDGGYSVWAVRVTDGEATRIEGCGALHHENCVPSSSYLPSKNHPAKKTVLITTDDSPSGEVFMWAGDQTSSDPNGFSEGTLYTLRVENFDFEHMLQGVVYTGTWTPIPFDIATAIGKAGYDQIDAYVNEQSRSTNFRKIEDISEDPNDPDTFYFAATGGPFTTNTSLVLNNTLCGLGTAIDGGCDNPFGKIYRMKINKTDPTGPCTIELVLAGSHNLGGAFDNVLVTRAGKVILVEDPTPTMLSEFLQPQNRYSRILSFDPKNGQIENLFEVDYATLQPNDPPYTVHMSHSGIIEFGDTEHPIYMCALQGAAASTPGDNNPDNLKIFTGQLTLFYPRDYQTVDPQTKESISFGIINPTQNCDVTSNDGGLIAALIVGWCVAGGLALICICLTIALMKGGIEKA